MRLASYVRVSKEEQVQGYSLEAQRLAIKRFCDRAGHEMVIEFSDEGRSARTDTLERRPGFQAAITCVQAKHADAIVVHKPDRAARNLRILLQTLYELGGGIVAVEGDFDYSTPEGRLRAHILGSVAQWYSDNLSREVHKGLDERKRSGLWSGRLPMGYVKQNGDRKLPPVPDRTPCFTADGRIWSKADLVVHVFELTASGESTIEIVRSLRAIGFNISRSTLDHIIHNRFYLGELPLDHRKKTRSDGRWVKGQHEALVSQQLFDRAQQRRKENHRGVKCAPSKAKTYPLSGLATCGSCHGPMHCRTDYTTGVMWVTCGNRYERGSCNQPSAKIRPLEEQIVRILDAYAPTADLLERGADLLKRDRRDHRHERDLLLRRRRRLLDLYEWGQIERTEYTMKMEALEREIARLAPVDDADPIRELKKFLRDLPALYRKADDGQRNALVRRLFDSFMIDNYAIVAVKPRPILDATLRAGAGTSGEFVVPQFAEVSNSVSTAGYVEGNRSVADVSSDPGAVGHVCFTPLADGWWTAPTADTEKPVYVRRRTRIPEEWWPALADAHAQGFTQVELARQWDVTRHTIGRTLKKYELAQSRKGMA